MNQSELPLIIWTPESLRAARERIGYSQKKIADLIGITPASISFIETGKTQSPLVILGYASVVETLYAMEMGYIPAYRKIGTNEFVEKTNNITL